MFRKVFANSYFLILEQRVKIAHHLHYPHLSREQSSAAIPPRAVRWGPALCTIGPFICTMFGEFTKSNCQTPAKRSLKKKQLVNCCCVISLLKNPRIQTICTESFYIDLQLLDTYFQFHWIVKLFIAHDYWWQKSLLRDYS